MDEQRIREIVREEIAKEKEAASTTTAEVAKLISDQIRSSLGADDTPGSR